MAAAAAAAHLIPDEDGPPVPGRRFCFTAFDNIDWLYENAKWSPKNVRFLVFQKELCPKSGRPHLQGYVELRTPTKYETVQNYWPPLGKFHLKNAKGSQAQNVAYCTKAETRIQEPCFHGEKAEQGRRTDLESIAHDLMGGASMLDLLESNPAVVIRNFKGLQFAQMQTDLPKKRAEPTLYYLCGAAGCGKSYVTREMVETEFKNDAYWCAEHVNGWFDGYRGEKVIVFDDFTGKYPLNDMLKLLDYGPLRINVKGGYVTVKADTFIFTSNFPVEQQYQHDPHQHAWLSRLSGERYSNTNLWDEEFIREMFKDLTGHFPIVHDRKRQDRKNALKLLVPSSPPKPKKPAGIVVPGTQPLPLKRVEEPAMCAEAAAELAMRDHEENLMKDGWEGKSAEDIAARKAAFEAWFKPRAPVRTPSEQVIDLTGEDEESLAPTELMEGLETQDKLDANKVEAGESELIHEGKQVRKAAGAKRKKR